MASVSADVTGLGAGTASATFGAAGFLDMIDTFDRPGKAFTKDTYSGTEAFIRGLSKETGKRIPRFGASAGAGVGHARAEWSVFEAEAKGPNARAGAEASSHTAGAMARAEVASASAAAGPLKVTVGLGFDTGATAGVDGFAVKFLGSGFQLGPKTSVSVFGNTVECVVM